MIDDSEKGSPKSVVLLYGPYIDVKCSSSYGGGTGGYTRNMVSYINFFKPENYVIKPSFHTFRGQLKFDNFLWRMIVDTFLFFRNVIKYKPDLVHVLAQYRTATPREFMVSILSSVFNKHFVYELKAGAFIDWYQSTNKINRYMIARILKNSNRVMVEGLPYIPFLKDEFKIDAEYLPNYMPATIVPVSVSDKLVRKAIHVLFVGYCYEGKGVYELVQGCNIAALNNVDVKLTIVGQEHDDFRQWLNDFNGTNNFEIKRLGRKDYSDVLSEFEKQDVYCYPTSHNGEGHNNTINEAMMYGLVIVTTKKGFLDTIINDERGYSLNEVSPEIIAQTLMAIDENRETAINKAKSARAYLKENYTSDQIFPTLERVYDEVLDC